MKYRAIISDIDGTIIKAGIAEIPSQKVLEAIQKAKEKGIIFVLATARPLALVEYLLELFPPDGYIILDNGASIYEIHNRELIWESLLNHTTAQAIWDIAQKHKQKAGIGVSAREGRFNNPEELPNAHIRRLNVKGLTYTQAENLKKELEALQEDITIVIPSSLSEGQLFDVFITNASASKQHAVLKLSDILSIPTQELIGIGDHYNDFPLLMACGFKVAMGNAVPELKEIADYIAPTVDEDGVADVIEKFILQPPKEEG